MCRALIHHHRLLMLCGFSFFFLSGVCTVWLRAQSSSDGPARRHLAAVTQRHVPDERASSAGCGHGGPLRLPHSVTVTNRNTFLKADFNLMPLQMCISTLVSSSVHVFDNHAVKYSDGN